MSFDALETSCEARSISAFSSPNAISVCVTKTRLFSGECSSAQLATKLQQEPHTCVCYLVQHLIFEATRT
jgi:hypothetical protein